MLYGEILNSRNRSRCGIKKNIQNLDGYIVPISSHRLPTQNSNKSLNFVILLKIMLFQNFFLLHSLIWCQEFHICKKYFYKINIYIKLKFQSGNIAINLFSLSDSVSSHFYCLCVYNFIVYRCDKIVTLSGHKCHILCALLRPIKIIAPDII